MYKVGPASTPIVRGTFGGIQEHAHCPVNIFNLIHMDAASGYQYCNNLLLLYYGSIILIQAKQ